MALLTAAALWAGSWQRSGAATAQHPQLWWHLIPAGLILALLFSAGFRALYIGGHHADLFGVAVAALVIWQGWDLVEVTSWHVPVLAVCVALGMLAHLAGDMLTHDGCPLLYPASRYEFGLLPEPVRETCRVRRWGPGCRRQCPVPGTQDVRTTSKVRHSPMTGWHGQPVWPEAGKETGMRTIPLCTATAIISALSLTGCASLPVGTAPAASGPSSARASASAPVSASASAPATASHSCAAAKPRAIRTLTVTVADNGKTFCVATGTVVEVFLHGTPSNMWQPIYSGSPVLAPRPDPRMALQIGVTRAAFEAVRPGTAVITSVRYPCRVPPSRVAIASGAAPRVNCAAVALFRVTLVARTSV